jgi:ASCH domain.
MKVISIMEPHASLIKEKIKYIETRSWNTNYRGEIYIHASKKKITKSYYEEKEEIINLLKDKEFKYGYIIAKCTLVDCKIMTKELIEAVKENYNEYISGEYKVGRYAWILENIETLENSIKAKGMLGIWNYEEDND